MRTTWPHSASPASRFGSPTCSNAAIPSRFKVRHKDTIQAVANLCANLWLLQEVVLAWPRVLVTLSDQEVYQRLRRAFGLPTPARFATAVGKPHPIMLGGLTVTLFPMIHPDISRPWGEGDKRKPAARQKWADIHAREHIPALRQVLGLPENA